MKRLALTLLAASALGLAGSAIADTDPRAIMSGAQLNPVMADAFQKTGTGVTIFHHTFTVMAPANCTGETASGQICEVLLNHTCQTPATFVVVHEKIKGNEEVVKAKEITVYPHDLFVMTYTKPLMAGLALDVVDFKKVN
jgi:hypothetical protein